METKGKLMADGVRQKVERWRSESPDWSHCTLFRPELEALLAENERLQANLKTTGDLMILHRDQACENGREVARLQAENEALKIRLSRYEGISADEPMSVQMMNAEARIPR